LTIWSPSKRFRRDWLGSELLSTPKSLHVVVGHQAEFATAGSSSASSASMGAQPMSIFTAASSSPRVPPRLMIAIGMPSAAAGRTNRYPEYTVSDDPPTSSAPALSTSEYASSTRSFGTLSPKYTMSGLSIPPHAGQSTITNDVVSPTMASASGATAMPPTASARSTKPGFAASKSSPRVARDMQRPQSRQTTWA